MTNQQEPTIDCLICDSNVFFNNKSLTLHLTAKKIYTTSGIIEELRDEHTKKRMEMYPFQLHVEEPESKDIQYVQEFSKKTGDFRQLSKVDISLVALAVKYFRREHEDITLPKGPGIGTRKKGEPIPEHEQVDDDDDEG